MIIYLSPEVEEPLDHNTNGIAIREDELSSINNKYNLEENNACPLDIIQNLKGFRTGHINIASFTKYIDQLQVYLQKESSDILTVNETRLDKHITDSIINMNGYSIVRHDRKRDGGGVAIFYRNCINVVLRSNLIPEELEAIYLY